MPQRLVQALWASNLAQGDYEVTYKHSTQKREMAFFHRCQCVQPPKIRSVAGPQGSASSPLTRVQRSSPLDEKKEGKKGKEVASGLCIRRPTRARISILILMPIPVWSTKYFVVTRTRDGARDLPSVWCLCLQNDCLPLTDLEEWLSSSTPRLLKPSAISPPVSRARKPEEQTRGAHTMDSRQCPRWTAPRNAPRPSRASQGCPSHDLPLPCPRLPRASPGHRQFDEHPLARPLVAALPPAGTCSHQSFGTPRRALSYAPSPPTRPPRETFCRRAPPTRRFPTGGPGHSRP